MLDNLNLDADYIIVWGGINDIYTGYPIEYTKFQLKMIYDKAHLARCKVIALTVSPSGSNKDWSQDKQDNVVKLNKFILESSADYKLDTYSLLGDGNGNLKPEYSSDGMHLTVEGYEMIGKALSRYF